MIWKNYDGSSSYALNKDEHISVSLAIQTSNFNIVQINRIESILHKITKILVVVSKKLNNTKGMKKD